MALSLSTNPEFDVVARAIVQIKNSIDATIHLGGSSYVFWGGREGYMSLLNTDQRREKEHMATMLRMARDYGRAHGFQGTFLIEPKPMEPTKHQYLKLNEFAVPTWLTWVCAITLASGIATGGWRIIKTVGSKLVRMNPMNGFAAQSMAALVIHVASHWGIPLSTTHVTSTSIMGVGATKRFSAVKWSVAGSMIWAWVLTLPITCLIGFFTFKIVQFIFGI